MLNYMGKVFTIVLIFIGMMIPILCHLTTSVGTSRLLVMNEMTLFLDKVADKGTITPSDLDELYNDVNAHGLVMDVDVNRMIRASFTEDDGTLKEAYIKADRLKKESGNCDNLTRAPVNCRSGKKFIERKVSGRCRRNNNKASLF